SKALTCFSDSSLHSSLNDEISVWNAIFTWQTIVYYIANFNYLSRRKGEVFSLSALYTFFMISLAFYTKWLYN
ncbi:MAG: hypothetical protein K5927_00860, partial [Lachnospiraceae bacterium]|nr:hypothetical protein [Lachnospiraceae bacterium]